MANSSVVTSLAAGKVRPYEYLGTVKYIPVLFDTDGVYSDEAMEFSDVLPPNTYVIGVHLTNTAIVSGALNMGVTGNVESLFSGVGLDTAGFPNFQGKPVAAGGKKIVGNLTGTMSSDEISGYILVVNDA